MSSSKDSAFWNSAARKYAASPISNEAAYQRKLELTRAYLSPDSDVLEVGCGTGSTALLHAPYVNHIRAVDFSDEMIAIAEEKRVEAGVSNITFETGAFDSLDAEPGRYDAVLALNVLHLLEDVPGALENTWTWLKPGGVFVSSTACLEGVWRAVIPATRLGRVFGKMPYVQTLTRKSLRRMTIEAGFEIAETWEPEKSIAFFMIARKPG